MDKPYKLKIGFILDDILKLEPAFLQKDCRCIQDGEGVYHIPTRVGLPAHGIIQSTCT